jgi:hypothetical protein
MIKIIFNILLILFVFNKSFSQIFESKFDEKLELNRREPKKEYDPPKFGHQPFLVLKVSPQYLFAQDNVFMFGGELAPPFGKFSLAADYGFGRGSWNINKDVRSFFNDQKTKIIRGELRAYFSDLYYFYSLDLKPLGRYYSIEYTQRDISVTRLVGVSNQGSFFELKEIPIKQAEWMVNLKLGKNFLISRWFMIDTHVGLGLKHYNVKTSDETIDNESITRYFINKEKRNWLPNEKGLLPSFVAGFRLCVPL